MFLQIWFLAASALFLSAQAPNTVPSAGISNSYIPPQPGSPFSATAVTETTKLQADGTSTVGKTISRLARDSKGRTRVENHFPLSPLDTSEARIRSITISDPIAHSKTVLDPAAMQAIVYNLSDVVESPPAPAAEDLGVADMEGLAAHGYRSQETIRLAGNQPVTFTREYWYSEQLQMNIKVRTGYPEGHTESFTLTQVSLNEPDEELFRIPPEYHVINTQNALRIGAAVAESNLITRVEPDYPALAKSARVQGTVEFSAIIGTDGLIKNLQLVRGHPLLVNAAKVAVLQWKYRPTLLDGSPVSVMAPVKVDFTLSGQN